MADTNNPLIAALQPLVSRVRTDVTAAKEVGEKHSTWRRVPLTDERLAQHLNGGPARGVCPIKAGESVTMVALLDFDSHGGETSWGEMAATAAGVADVLQLAWGAPTIAFRSSGGRGIHLYLLWDEPQDAYSVREWLRQVLASCGLRSGTRGVVAREVEIFPKQDEVPVGGFGNQFILPLAGASEPLEYDDLADTLVPRSGGKAGAVDLVWPVAAPVPVLERPVRAAKSAQGVGEGRPWRDALDALGNGLGGSVELGYDEWFRVVCAIHHETGGSDEGLALAHAWSARAAKYDPAFLDERVWPYIKTGGERGDRGGAAVTGGTIMSLAGRVGWSQPLDADAFPVVEAPRREAAAGEGGRAAPGAHEEGDELPNFDREKSGAIKATVDNAVKAMRRPDLVGLRIGHDEFRDEITVARRGTDEWVPMTDADLVRLRIAMEQMGFKAAPKELARDAVVLVAAERRYDSAQLWLKGLVWDGQPRVDRFLTTYMGTADTPYTRAVGRYMWTALAGRVLQPGVKADMVPIYEGDQGLRKSSAIEAISPAPDFFVEIDLEEREEDTVRKLRGALVGEIAELSGLHTRALEAIKKFVVRKVEKWVPKYKEFPSVFARRLLFIGSTNKTEILADETGNRRWLPVHIERADAEGIARDRDQLWAEAALMFSGVLADASSCARVGWTGLPVAPGVAWQAAEMLAVAEHEAYTLADAWDDAVRAWLRGEEDPSSLMTDQVLRVGPRGGSPFTTSDCLHGALGLKTQDMNRLSSNRVSAILRRFGYKQQTVRIAGEPVRGWVQVDAQGNRIL